VFTLFHPEIMIKGRMDVGLIWRYLRLLQRGERGWLARLARSLADRWRTYRRVPVWAS
jgi:hypothetical protein